MEILAGLEQKTVIIPVLLADTEMPSAQSLPKPLQPFARRNAIEISDSRFYSDVDRLIEVIEKIFNPQRAAVPPIRPEHRNQSSTPFISASSRPNMSFIAAAVVAVALIVAGIWWFTTGGEREASFQAEPYIQSPYPVSGNSKVGRELTASRSTPVSRATRSKPNESGI